MPSFDNESVPSMNTVLVKEYKYLNKFNCLADKCEDPCCGQPFGKNIEKQAYQKYQQRAPELLDYVELHEDRDLYLIKPGTNGCSLWDDSGLCKIHSSYGTEFLSDTCHFYPRVHTQIGENIFVNAKVSCPEVSRIILTEEDPFSLVETETDRIPIDVLGQSVDAERERRALVTHEIFVNESQREDLALGDLMSRVLLVSKQLDSIDKFAWCDHAQNLFDELDTQAFKTETLNETHNFSFEIMQYFLNRWSKEALTPRLRELMERIQDGISDAEANEKLATYYGRADVKPQIDDALKRYFVYQMIRRTAPYSQEKGLDGVFENAIPAVVSVLVFRTALLACLKDRDAVPSVENIQPILFLLTQKIEHAIDAFGPELKGKGLLSLAAMGQAIYSVH